MHKQIPRLRRETLLSVLVRRVVGPAFIVGGIVLGAYTISGLATNGPVLVQDQPTDDWFFVAVAVLLPFIIAVLGILLCRADPHCIDE